MHDIPSLSRPIAASSIMSNNIQVSLLAFGFGLTAGIGTSAILLFNGMYLGAIAGWFSVQGNSRALWGWVMPHGGVELLAICIAGAGGFLLAKAIYCPGQVSRRTALKKMGEICSNHGSGCHCDAGFCRFDRRLCVSKLDHIPHSHCCADIDAWTLGVLFRDGWQSSFFKAALKPFHDYISL